MNKYSLLNKELFEKLRENGQIVVPVRNQIILTNIKLAYKVAGKFSDTRDIEYDDAVQIACLTLQKAVEEFDKSKGVEFSTYATTMIKYALYGDIGYQKRHHRWKNKWMSVEFATYYDKYDREYLSGETEELILGDIIPDITETFEDKVIHADYLIVQDAKNKVLSDMEKYIVDNIYSEDPKSYREIGENIGKTKQGVDFIEGRAIGKIKSNLSVDRYNALEKM